ncbi:MAG: inositol 2-dehydrogenase [Bacteroidota bacterium]
MKKIKIGLTGLGRIGKVHLESLVFRLPEAEVLAVSDPNPDTAAVAESYGVDTFYESYEEVLAHPGIEAVVICSPTGTHKEYIEKAAAAGKHIFCEKPLEMTVAKIQSIDDTVKKHGVKLQVGFNRRFDADFAAVKDQVVAGNIGEPHILRITSRDPGPPPVSYIEGSGGLFMDMTIHDFDMARYIVGSEVKEVYAKGAVRVDPAIGIAGDVDTATIQLTFEDGTLACIDNSRKAVYGYDQRMEIFGSKGMSQIKNEYANTQYFYDERGSHGPPALNFFMERYTQAYYVEMREFIRAIWEDKDVPCDAYDALMATKIAVAAKRSMDENRPVLLSEL